MPPPAPRGKRPPRGINPKEREFVLHYFGAANRIATDAALMVGWGKGNRSAARNYASDVMARPHVIAEVERIQTERAQRLAYNADDVLRDLLVLKTDVEAAASKSGPAMRTRLDVLKTLGEHISVGAFRRQVGLSAPGGGPIETVDLAKLASLSDEELDQLERARAILDSLSGGSAAPADDSGDSSGEGAPTQDA